ncbi:tyrosine-type recombinase/integrase [Halovenus salina]|uniref:Tyrosine-type recombinase/integrase n=1 Tax=Halovenus salina TaxID=1510225 RepID=A0ABD5W372_9EURY
MVHLAQIDAPPRNDGLEKAIQDRLADLDSGKYKRNNAHVLRLCAEWLRREHDVNRVEEITSQDLRQFARALRECMDNEKSNINAGSTVTQYYDYVAAWLGWAVRDQYLDRNPARTETATEPLPEVSTDPDRQFWSDREREAICATTDQLVDVALDNPDEQARRQAYRDRALVYLLAYSGCRGAEIAAVNDDEKRNGLRWRDLNLDDGIISVYGKSREWEEAPCSNQRLNHSGAGGNCSIPWAMTGPCCRQCISPHSMENYRPMSRHHQTPSGLIFENTSCVLRHSVPTASAEL